MKKLTTPLSGKTIQSLKAGDEILLSGEVYTARDQAHKKLVELLEKNKPLPIELTKTILFYCGPSPAPKGKVIGSCGPTTASRMDSFSPILMKFGSRVMIGKGNRSDGVKKAIKKHRGLYLVAYGGCGALAQERVIRKEVIAFPELGPEAIYLLEIKEFPLIVGIDSMGKSCLS